VVVLRRERHSGEVVTGAPDDHDGAVLALARIVLVGNPRPDDLARIRRAVRARCVLDGERIPSSRRVVSSTLVPADAAPLHHGWPRQAARWPAEESLEEAADPAQEVKEHGLGR